MKAIHLMSGEKITANPGVELVEETLGIRLVGDDGDTFFPWSAIKCVTTSKIVPGNVGPTSTHLRKVEAA